MTGYAVTLADQWRDRAARLEEYARRCRSWGDTREAEDAERAALDYREAADARDLAGEAS